EETDEEEENYTDDADRRVLPVQVGLGAGLNRGRDFLHPRIACRLGEYPANRNGAVGDRRYRADEREDERIGHGTLPSKVRRMRSPGRHSEDARGQTCYFASARSKKSSRSWPQNNSPSQTYVGEPNTPRSTDYCVSTLERRAMSGASARATSAAESRPRAVAIAASVAG